LSNFLVETLLNKNNQRKDLILFNISSVHLFWLVWFSLCLLPVLYDNKFSANYLIFFTPLIYLFVNGRLINTNSQILSFYIVISIIIFIIATAYQTQFYNYIDRRLISFIIFLTQFSLIFIKFTERMKKSFLLSVLLSSICYSIFVLYELGKIDDYHPSIIKDLIGSQRTGIIHFFSLFICCYLILNYRLTGFARLIVYISLLSSIFGLVTTFSRATYISIFISLSWTFLVVISEKWRYLSFWKNSVIYIALIFFVIASVLILYPSIIVFIYDRLVGLIIDGVFFTRFESFDTSEGLRLYIWKDILEFLYNNPFTGTGYLGSWVISDATTSSHNDFFDRLGRTGFVSFLIYIYILFLLYRFLFKFYFYLWIPFVACLVYGMMHETFSQSPGTVIFAYLLMLYSNSKFNSAFHSSYLKANNKIRL